MNSVDPGISSPRQSSRKRQRTSTADELQPLTAATAVGLSRNSNPSRSNSNSRSASPFVRASNSNTNSKEKEKEVDSDATVDDPITQIINQIPIGQGQDGGEGEASTSYSTRSDNKTGASNPSTPRLLKKGNRTLEEADRSRSGSPGGKRAAGTGRGGKLKGSPGRKPKDQANGGLVIRIESPKEKEKGKGKNEGKDKLKEVQLGEMEKEIQRESQTQKDDVDVEMQLDPNSFEDSVRETEKEKEREPETIEVEKEVVEIEESPEELEKELELKNQREEGQKIKAAKDKEMEETLLQGWKEEFFEIVEQLPLELQRSFALMRELEQQMHSRLESISNTSKAYRNARIVLEGGEPQEEETTTLTEKKDSNNLNSSSEGRVQIEGQNEKEIEIDGQPESGGISVSTSQVLEEESMDVEMSSLLPSSSTTSQDKESASRNLAQEKVTPTPNPSTHNPENSASTGIQSRAARRALLKHIADSSTEAIRSAEEKIGLAATAYDWVDRHIRRLDSDLLKSESNLSLGLRPGTEQSNVVRDSISVSGNGKGKGKNPSGMGLDVNRNGNGAEGNSLEIDFNGEGVENGIEGNKKKIRRHAPKNHRIEMEEFSVLPDMPIDPNEPRYCYCDQVSFGDMVACENDDCPREWFHYHCVDLLSQPKGKWWCQFCAPKGWRGLGASIPPGAPFVPPGMRRS